MTTTDSSGHPSMTARCRSAYCRLVLVFDEDLRSWTRGVGHRTSVDWPCDIHATTPSRMSSAAWRSLTEPSSAKRRSSSYEARDAPLLSEGAASVAVTSFFFLSSERTLDAARMDLACEAVLDSPRQLDGAQRRLVLQLASHKVHHLAAQLV